MSEFLGYVVAVNGTNGKSPGFEKAVGGVVYPTREEGEAALEDACVLPGANPDGSAPVSTAFGLYEATVEVGRRLDRTVGDVAAKGWVVLDIRADGYTIEAFDPSEIDDGTPDHVVTRNFDTADAEWAEETARAEIGRMAASRGWRSYDVGLNVDRELLIGGDPATSAPRP